MEWVCQSVQYTRSSKTVMLKGCFNTYRSRSTTPGALAVTLVNVARCGYLDEYGRIDLQLSLLLYEELE
jgi:hypothetical protein